MAQERLTGTAMISIEQEIEDKHDVDKLIQIFSKVKELKINFR